MWSVEVRSMHLFTNHSFRHFVLWTFKELASLVTKHYFFTLVYSGGSAARMLCSQNIPVICLV